MQLCCHRCTPGVLIDVIAASISASSRNGSRLHPLTVERLDSSNRMITLICHGPKRFRKNMVMDVNGEGHGTSLGLVVCPVPWVI